MFASKYAFCSMFKAYKMYALLHRSTFQISRFPFQHVAQRRKKEVPPRGVVVAGSADGDEGGTLNLLHRPVGVAVVG